MRRDDHRRAVHGRHVREQVDDLAARRRVEVAGRLVGEHDARVDGECARDRDALLLAARQVCGKMDRALCEADFVEQGERAIAEIRIADAGRGELRLDVLDGGQRRDQIELLEDEAERAQAQLCELVVG